MFDLSPDEWTAIRLSLRIAIVATLVAMPFGIAVAWLLARKDFWGKALVDGIVHLPLVLPPVVTGYLLLISFGRRGAHRLASRQYFGIVFSFRWTGAALACGVMGFSAAGARHAPVVRGHRPQAGGRRLDSRRQSALGFSHRDTCRSHLPGVIAGMVLCFAKALGEFGATITSSPTFPAKRRPFPPRSTLCTQFPGGDAAARAGWFSSPSSLSLDGADRLRMVRAACRHALPRRLIMLPCRCRKRLGDFSLVCDIRSRGRRHRSVRPFRVPARPSLVNMIAGLVAPDRGRIVARRYGAVRFKNRT